jgi:hypothetical protein
MAATGSRYPTAEQLLDEARRATGLTDFGPGRYREGLEVVLKSLAEDAKFSRDSDAAVLEPMRRRLRNRLLVEDWLARHPGTAEAAIEGPVSIMGLPRTGTTALGNMMSLDERFRSLRGWEQKNPVPPPVAGEEQNDPRRVEAVKEIEYLLEHRPDQAAMHIFEVDATLEDTDLLGMEFHGQGYTQPVYGYHAWWRECDMRPTFAYHRRVVALLQSRRPPNRWLFKAPHHKFHLEAMVSAYPDIRFIMTHRDPAKVVPSYASLVGTLFPPAESGQHDQKRLGREVCDHLRIGMQHCIEQRARLGESRFIDVHQSDLDRDPLGTLDRVYKFLGYEFTPQLRDRIVTWQAQHKSGAHGTHRYTAEQFGLSKEQIRSDYDFYIKHFDVAIEG